MIEILHDKNNSRKADILIITIHYCGVQVRQLALTQLRKYIIANPTLLDQQVSSDNSHRLLSSPMIVRFGSLEDMIGK